MTATICLSARYMAASQELRDSYDAAVRAASAAHDQKLLEVGRACYTDAFDRWARFDHAMLAVGTDASARSEVRAASRAEAKVAEAKFTQQRDAIEAELDRVIDSI